MGRPTAMKATTAGRHRHVVATRGRSRSMPPRAKLGTTLWALAKGVAAVAAGGSYGVGLVDAGRALFKDREPGDVANDFACSATRIPS